MKLIAITVTSLLVLSMGSAFADYGYVKSSPPVEYGDWNASTTIEKQSVDVCIYKPYDSYMDSELPNIILAEVQIYHTTAKILSVRDQMSGNFDCKYIIKIDRAINENYRYTERTTKYLLSDHTATVFAYKTGQPMTINSVPLEPMTNINCMLEAHANKYFDNYHISDQGYYQTLHPTCSPFGKVIDRIKIGELPINVIRDSVDNVIAKLGV